MQSTQAGQETPVRSFAAGNLVVNVYASRLGLGRAAALDAAAKLEDLFDSSTRSINMIFAAAPSQNEFLQQLIQEQDIDWSLVNAFHMDEYAGISQSSPQSFAYFLEKSIFDKLPFKEVH